MYNEEVKRKFLEEEAKNKVDRVHFSSVLNAFCRFEQLDQVDVAEMCKPTIIRCLEDLGLDEIATVRAYITVGNRYVKWCRASGYFVGASNGFDGLSVDDIDISGAIERTFFRNDGELINLIQAVHDLDSGYADAPVLALAWLGLTMKEVLALRDSDVDLEGRIIHLPDGNSINGFSDIIHDVLYRYSICRVSSRDKGNITQEVVKDMSINSFIKRMIPRGSKFFGRPVSHTQVRGQLDLMITKCRQSGSTCLPTFSNVWRSGRFYKLYQVEQSGVDVFDFRNRPIIEEVFRHKKNYHDTIKMYRWYKKAFSLE